MAGSTKSSFTGAPRLLSPREGVRPKRLPEYNRPALLFFLRLPAIRRHICRAFATTRCRLRFKNPANSILHCLIASALSTCISPYIFRNERFFIFMRLLFRTTVQEAARKVLLSFSARRNRKRAYKRLPRKQRLFVVSVPIFMRFYPYFSV